MPIIRSAVMLGRKKYSPPRISTNLGIPLQMNGAFAGRGHAGPLRADERSKSADAVSESS